MTTTQELTTRQRRVAHWAHEVTTSTMYTWCILDTETTSLNGEIVDIAILDPQGNVLLDQLVKPQGRIEEAAAEIHGIDEELVAGAPGFLDVWPRIFDVLAQYQRIITFNADFDTRILMNTGNINGLRIHCCIGGKIWPPVGTQFEIKASWMCLMKQYAEFWGEPSQYGDRCKWQSLYKACRQQGIAHENWHRALGDCQAALKLLRVLAGKYVAPEQEQEEEGKTE